MRKTEIEETTMTDINKIENGPMLNLYPDSLGADAGTGTGDETDFSIKSTHLFLLC